MEWGPPPKIIFLDKCEGHLLSDVDCPNKPDVTVEGIWLGIPSYTLCNECREKYENILSFRLAKENNILGNVNYGGFDIRKRRLTSEEINKYYEKYKELPPGYNNDKV